MLKNIKLLNVWIVPFACALLLATGVRAKSTADIPTTVPFCKTVGTVWDILYLHEVFYLVGNFTLVRPPVESPDIPAAETWGGLVACDARTGAILRLYLQIDSTNSADLSVETITASPDGNTIYIGGKFDKVAGVARKNAAAFDRITGALTEWNPSPSRLNDIVISRDGATAYLAGSFGVAAYETTGAGNKLAAFAPSILTADGAQSSVRGLALSADGATLYIGGGQFATVNGKDRRGAAAIDRTTGQITRPFAPDLSDTNPKDGVVQIYDIIPYGNALYLCGDWWLTEGGVANGGWGEENSDGRQANLGRFDPITGKADLSWTPWTNGGVQGCDIDPIAGLLVAVGHFDKFGGATDLADAVPVSKGLAAFDLQSSNPIDWRPVVTNADNFDAQLWAAEVAGGRIAVGGQFEMLDALDQEGAASFSFNRHAVLVVDQPAALRGGDVLIYDRLTRLLGFAVQLVDDDNATGHEADSADLLLISATSSSTKLGTKYRASPAPAIIWRPWLFNEMQMSEAAESNMGALTGTVASLVALDHPLTAGLSGTITLATSTRTFGWAKPLPSADVILRMVDPADQQAKAIFFAYEKGDLLADGTSAASCRIGLPAYESTALGYTNEAWMLFDEALRWSLNCPTATISRSYLPLITR